MASIIKNALFKRSLLYLKFITYLLPNTLPNMLTNSSELIVELAYYSKLSPAALSAY